MKIYVHSAQTKPTWKYKSDTLETYSVFVKGMIKMGWKYADINLGWLKYCFFIPKMNPKWCKTLYNILLYLYVLVKKNKNISFFMCSSNKLIFPIWNFISLFFPTLTLHITLADVHKYQLCASFQPTLVSLLSLLCVLTTNWPGLHRYTLLSPNNVDIITGRRVLTTIQIKSLLFSCIWPYFNLA